MVVSIGRVPHCCDSLHFTDVVDLPHVLLPERQCLDMFHSKSDLSMMNLLKFPRWIPDCVSLYCWWSKIHCVWIQPMV